MNKLSETGNPAVSDAMVRPLEQESSLPLQSPPGSFWVGANSGSANASLGSQRAAFAGLFLFTLLLYIRPNELFPGIFGTFPLTKIVAMVAVLVLSGPKLGRRRTA